MVSGNLCLLVKIKLVKRLGVGGENPKRMIRSIYNSLKLLSYPVSFKSTEFRKMVIEKEMANNKINVNIIVVICNYDFNCIIVKTGKKGNIY
jgi:hypothetical protein